MNIELNLKNNAFHFEAVNETQNTVQIDASPGIGGEGKGARPMELLIMGLGGCSAIDVLSILRKQKIEVSKFKITIQAEREKDAVPSLFTDIHIEYWFDKNLDKDKAKRAIELSLNKYCSVAKTLEKTARITYDMRFEL
ncbi:MAG: OsmC family protein [Cytophagaceae bacterium]|nr:OsmC family protein [Cytophagaceae bacterium]MDW8455996.1 OsmC family protein [Cytophagaceae bacterium]